MNGWIDIWMDRWMNGLIDKWMDKWMDGKWLLPYSHNGWVLFVVVLVHEAFLRYYVDLGFYDQTKGNNKKHDTQVLVTWLPKGSKQ